MMVFAQILLCAISSNNRGLSHFRGKATQAVFKFNKLFGSLV